MLTFGRQSTSTFSPLLLQTFRELYTMKGLTLVRRQALLKRLNKFSIINSLVACGCWRSGRRRVRRHKQRSTVKAGPPAGPPSQ